MNHLIRMDKKDDMVYLTCQTDGESLLTMEQVEQTLEEAEQHLEKVDPVEEILATLPNKVRDEIEILRELIQDRTERAMLWGYLRALEHMGVITREQRHTLKKVKED